MPQKPTFRPGGPLILSHGISSHHVLPRKDAERRSSCQCHDSGEGSGYPQRSLRRGGGGTGNGAALRLLGYSPQLAGLWREGGRRERASCALIMWRPGRGGSAIRAAVVFDFRPVYLQNGRDRDGAVPTDLAVAWHEACSGILAVPVPWRARSKP